MRYLHVELEKTGQNIKQLEDLFNTILRESDYNLKLNDAKNMLQIELSILKKAIEILCEKYNFIFWNYTCQISSYFGVVSLTFQQVYRDCKEKIQAMDLIDTQNPYSFMWKNGGM